LNIPQENKRVLWSECFRYSDVWCCAVLKRLISLQILRSRRYFSLLVFNHLYLLVKQ